MVMLPGGGFGSPGLSLSLLPGERAGGFSAVRCREGCLRATNANIDANADGAIGRLPTFALNKSNIRLIAGGITRCCGVSLPLLIPHV